ncbi:MAG TPA: PIN domain-containing protein [Xanthobacteraceae bacterium]|nr:PIN domain-containing protein [Xanthobacteraceae bacterium]
MTRYLLDTNVISEVTRREPSAALLDWLEQQPRANLFVATFTLAEIKRGILAQPFGRKRRELENWFNGSDGPLALFQGRILAFDETAADEWARIMAEGSRSGRPRSGLDMIVAATTAANHCIVATLNERHFRGVVDFINPVRVTS